MIRHAFFRVSLALAGCALFACSTQIRHLASAVAEPVALLEAVGANSVVAGACSSAISITREDEDGAALALTVPTTVSLADYGSGRFYSDSGCSSAITAATIPAGATSVSVYFRDTLAESLSLGFSVGTLDPANHALTVSADTPVTLAYSAVSSTSANSCTALAVVREDQFGNPAAPASPTSVTLGGVGNGAFYTGSTCATTTTTTTIASGASSQTVYYRDSVVETGLTLTATGLTTDASRSFAITGPFAASVSIANATSGFPSAGNTYHLATADFDGDGKPDLVTTNDAASDEVFVAWGDGAGSVAAGPTISVGNEPYGVVAVSLRANGKYDIVTANTGAAANTSNISVILGNGDRTFGAATSYNSGLSLHFANDLDSGVNLIGTSGYRDLVVTYFGDSGTKAGAGVEIFPGNGDGTFGAPTSYADDGIGQGPPNVADINHDGAPDFAIPLTSSGSANAKFYMNSGGGTGFTTSLFCPGGPNFGTTWAFGDFNGDHFPDWGLGLSSYGLFANTGDGTTTFTNVLSDTSFSNSSSRRARSGVFTASGNTDLIFVQNSGTAQHNGLVLFPGNGNGTFGRAVLYPLTGTPTDAVVGDFNSDGKSDVMLLMKDGTLRFFAGQ